MNNIQVKAKIIGKSGCYFLSLIYAAIEYARVYFNKSVKIDVLKFYDKCVENKSLDSDCTVLNPAVIVANILEIPVSKVSARHSVIGYTPTFNEIEITRYELAELGITYAHFVVTRDNEIVYDPYGKSNTCNKGKPVSKRIITINK